jgi:indoleacetamide hydrolase
VATDTGGSIRIPASFAGIVGLRPTKNAVPLDGVVPLSSSRDTVGPMAPTVRDVATIFPILAQRAPCDPVKRLKGAAGGKRFRVGLLTEFFAEVAALNGAVEILKKRMGAVDAVDFPARGSRASIKRHKSTSNYEFKAEIERYFEKTVGSLTLEELWAEARRDCVEADHRCRRVVEDMEIKVKKAGSVPSSFREEWTALAEELKQYFSDHQLDAVAYPTFSLPPSLLTESKQAFCPNNRLAASTGFPALTLFAGFAHDDQVRLPVGLEFMALPNEECVLFALGEEFETFLGESGRCEHKV